MSKNTPRIEAINQDSGPVFLATYAVRAGLQLSPRFQTDDIPGLRIIQVTATNSGGDVLHAFWQGEEWYKANWQVFCERLIEVDPAAELLYAGHQRQIRSQQPRLPVYKAVLRWEFLVRTAAAWGVLVTLATYSESFSDWAFAVPRVSAIDSGRPIELVEMHERTHTLRFRNDSRAGNTLLTVHRVYAVSEPSGQQSNLVFPEGMTFQRRRPGDIMEIETQFPRLHPGNYVIRADVTQQNGWMHDLVSRNPVRMEIGRARVAPVLKVSKARLSPISDLRPGQAFVTVDVVSGLRCPGLKGRVSLKNANVTIETMICSQPTEVISMKFPKGVSGESGVTYTTGALDAREHLTLTVVLKGPGNYSKEQWLEIVDQLYVSRPAFVSGGSS